MSIPRPEENTSFLPSEHSSFLGPIPGVLHHPLVILFCQAVTFGIAWALVIFLACHRDPIPLSDTITLLINRYQSETTLISTLIATALASITTFFFHAAVKQAVVRFLSRRVSLFDLCSAIEFSTGSAVSSAQHIRWTASTHFCVLLLGTLTAAWSSIISPVTIPLNIQVTGQEIDVTSVAWLPYMARVTGSSLFVETDSEALSRNLNNISLYDEDVGNAAMSSATASMLGNMSILSYINSAFDTSTGGVIAINNPMIPDSETGDSTTNAYPHITAIAISGKYYRGLSAIQTFNQQGITANVSCQSQDVTDQATYPFLVLSNITSTVKGQDATWYMTSTSWNTTCSDAVSFVMNDVLTFSPRLYGPFLAASVCPLQNFEGPSNQSFLIALHYIFPESPAYSGSQLCEVTPLLTTVQAEYAGGVINIGETLSSSTLEHIDPSGLMVYFLGQFFSRQLYSSQASNIMGNYILIRIYDFFSTQLPSTSLSNVNWSSFFEDYLRGAVEGYMTELRTASVSQFSTTTTSVPELQANVSRTFSGTIQVTTKGWKFSVLGNLVALLPITATFILSIFVLLFPMSYRAKSPPNGSGKRVTFDPASIVSIIRAGAAGGVGDFFQGLHETDVSDKDKDEDDNSLSIGLTPKNKIGFVQSNTHSPIPYRR